MLGVLARKDFYARYRRTSLGMLWAVGLPAIQAAVLSVVFSHVIHVSSALHRTNGHGAYPVFVYSGITAWSYFATNMPNAATAIVDNVGLAGKIYFPRALFPLLVVTTGLYPLGIGIGVLLLVTLIFQHHVGIQFLMVVPGALLAVGITAGIGLMLSAVHVYFRDVRYLVQAAMSVLFYVSPIIYSIDIASQRGVFGKFVSYGPMAGPIELFRYATVGLDHDWLPAVVGGCVWFVVCTAVGMVIQSRYDRVFTDLL